MKLTYRTPKNAEFISNFYGKPLDKPEWYNINAISDEEAEIFVYDYIGWPFNDAGDFVRQIAGMKQPKITIRINSPGGDVWDANAIFNAIKNHKSKTITRIESLAASAASYISLAGKEKQAYKNSFIMIHEPAIFIFGMFNQYGIENLNEDAKELLVMVSNTMIDMYADNTNVGKRDLKEMLKAGTWMNAKTAKEKGFIDTIIEAGEPVKSQFDLSMFDTVPNDLKKENGHNTDPTEREIEKALRDVGLSKNKAKAMLAGSKPNEADKEEIKRLQSDISKLEIKTSLQKLIMNIGGN